jgi:hypothetical protein
MKLVATDPESRVDIYQLTDDSRPADNIYGEQPYSDPASQHIAVRFYADGVRDGELAILDLESGELRTAIDESPRFPAFHPWSEYLYCQQAVGGETILRRWRYDTLERDDILTLPRDVGSLSYGTVSPDHALYAVSIVRPDESRCVMLFDLASGENRIIAESTGRYHFKHEQFSRDGTNRLLIQANVIPEVKEVHLGWFDISDEGMTRFAADQPHTLRPTGHENWIGDTDRIFFSTAWSGEEHETNVYDVGVGESKPKPVPADGHRFGHVSASSCGRYWIADATGEDGVPIYAGAFDGRVRRLLVSETVDDGNQWSHTHPYLTADNRWLIFTSSRDGLPQVYGARVPSDFWESLVD